MIQLIEYPIRRETGRQDLRRQYRSGTGFAARRRGALLVNTSGSHVRTWVSVERARKALERDFPGEEVVGP